jgi:hypothetical protein
VQGRGAEAGRPSPHFAFLAKEWRMPQGEGKRGTGGSGALSFQTPHYSQAPTSQGYSEQWGGCGGGKEGLGKPEQAKKEIAKSEAEEPGERQPRENWE